MTFPHEYISDFISQPWCRTLFLSPDLVIRPTLSREAPQPNKDHCHSFFSSTLATATGLRAVLSFEERSTGNLLMLFSLGTGLNGPAGIIHGGLIMTLLDAATAQLAHRVTKAPVLTTEHLTAFQQKIVGPCIVLARAWVTGISGNTIITEAQLEDGNGNIYAKTKATLLKRAAKM